MKMWLKIALGVMLCAGNTVNAQNAAYAEQVKNYISQYREAAIAEQKRSGIPASITLAQGIHETVAGSSELATMANNHFGIKCKKEWTGETFAHTDDAPNECFRKYPTALASYKDHSDYLVKSPRYAALFTLPVTDYAGWAKGLRQAGYATNPRYAQALIKLVEDYQLQDFTYAALGAQTTREVARQNEIIPEHDAPATPATEAPVIAPSSQETVVVNMPPAAKISKISASGIKTDENNNSFPAYGQVTRVHGLKAVYAKKGDTPLEYAFKYDIRYERLLEINDIGDKPLPFDMYLYLERKNFTADVNTRTLKEGESLLQIAQEEGVQLKFVRAMNLLEPGEEPVTGTQIELQHRARVKPSVTISKVPENIVKPAVATTIIPVAAVATAPVTEAERHPEEAERTEVIPAEATAVPVIETPVEVITKPAEVQAPPVVTTSTTPTPQGGKDTDELDALKAKFDRVIYTDSKTATTPAPAPKEEGQPAPKATPGAKYYVVKKGDTAFSIAKRNNITMRQLMDWNKLDFEGIKVGQKLRVQQ